MDKNTQLCISIAARPGSFGTVLHNTAYAALGLNFVYKACSVSDVREAMNAVRTLGIRGCSVSMPFKQLVIPCLDEVDPEAGRIGAVNTVVNYQGVLTGYNTDLAGILGALHTLSLRPKDRILVLGNGGSARAILAALWKLGIGHVSVAARKNRQSLSQSFLGSASQIEWENREKEEADVLINATPIGMCPDNGSMPVCKHFLDSCRAVMDMVMSPFETKLIQYALSRGKLVAPGYQVGLEQVKAQFFLYTGVAAPQKAMQEAMKQLVGGEGMQSELK